MNSALRAVFFDMDGLLVDTEPLWYEVEHAVMAKLGSEWTRRDQRALVGGSLPRSVGYLIGRARRQASPEQVGGWLIDGMTALLAQRGVTPMPGAVELVGQVRGAGLPCALVTSSERVIMDAVLAVLAGHAVAFDATVCGGDVHSTKPDPEPYLRAAALLAVDPRRCVALEDSPNGVASAEAAGCVTIAVPSVTTVDSKPGRFIATSLAQVDLALIRSLADQAGAQA